MPVLSTNVKLSTAMPRAKVIITGFVTEPLSHERRILKGSANVRRVLLGKTPGNVMN